MKMTRTTTTTTTTPSPMRKSEMPGSVKTASGEIFFSTEELSHFVRELAAVKLGVALPVYGEVQWMWAPGQGPVVRVTVEHLPNVTPLAGRRPRRGKSA